MSDTATNVHVGVKCPKCSVIIHQCKCTMHDKTYVYEICNSCKAGASSRSPQKMTNAENVIQGYVKRARHLKEILHLEQFRVDNREDAKAYLDLSAEYKFITELLDELGLLNWSKRDVEGAD